MIDAYLKARSEQGEKIIEDVHERAREALNAEIQVRQQNLANIDAMFAEIEAMQAGVSPVCSLQETKSITKNENVITKIPDTITKLEE